MMFWYQRINSARDLVFGGTNSDLQNVAHPMFVMLSLAEMRSMDMYTSGSMHFRQLRDL